MKSIIKPTNEQKAAAVMAVVMGQQSTAEVAASLDVSIDDVESWRSQYLKNMAGVFDKSAPSSSVLKQHRRLLMPIAIACVLLLSVVSAKLYSAVTDPAPVDCKNDPNYDLVCFDANTPAKANDVNYNFKTLNDNVNNNFDTLNTNVNSRQKRVTGTCGNGKYVQSINVCAHDVEEFHDGLCLFGGLAG